MTTTADPYNLDNARRKRRKVKKPRRSHGNLVVPGLLLVLRSVVAAAFVLTMRAPRHMRQYILGALMTTLLCWSAVLLYIFVTPPTYSSRWSFILPTSSSTSSVQVETIGHTQISPSSPFGSSSLSPKVIYKEIITSERVRLAAAKSMGMTLVEFGMPQVKLIDETSLLLLDVRGSTPAITQAKANALITTFNEQLDILRNDEIRRRAEVVQESLKSYQLNLQAARERILEQQRVTGVLSISQFSEASTSMELMRRRLGEVRADLAKLTAEQERMTQSLGMDSDSASLLLKLSGDPAFYKLANDFAEANAAYQQDSIRMGPANPVLALTRNRSKAAYTALAAAVQTVATDPGKVEKLLYVINGSQRAELIKQLIGNQSALSGKREELASLEADFKRLDEDVKRMSTAAARLEDLKKDHLVAEAVFTSALARLDTNKVDIYASYPMVQTLAAPDLPMTPTSPYVLIAILVGVLATILSALAWGLAWLRHMFNMRRLNRGVVKRVMFA